MMKQQVNAEIQVLDRILYLLEEGSVSRLAVDDSNFGDFIERLYLTVDSESTQLRRIAS